MSTTEHQDINIDLEKSTVISYELIESTEKQFHEIANAFRFDFRANRIAKNGYTIVKNGEKVGVIPRMYEYWLNVERLPTYEDMVEIAKISKWKADGHDEYGVEPESALVSKIRNCWTGWLREVHAIIYLQKFDSYGKFWYSKDIDMKEGVDIIYRRSTDQKLFGIAIAHKGSGSSHHEVQRKDSKRLDYAVILRSQQSRENGDGLDVISPSILQDLVCGLLDLSKKEN